MQKSFVLVFSCIFFSGIFAFGQTTFLPLQSEYTNLLDRIETKSGRLSDSLCLQYKSEYFQLAEDYCRAKVNENNWRATATDLASIKALLGASFMPNPMKDTMAKSIGFLYDRTNFFKINHKGFFLAVNPVFNLMSTRQQGTPSESLFLGSYGGELKVMVPGKFGLYALVTQNREQTPSFISNYVASEQALPGISKFSISAGGIPTYRYTYSELYLNVPLINKYLDLTVGNGKNFIGDGIRSLFLSDNSANTNFAKINARVWKMNYQILLLQLAPHVSIINQSMPNTWTAIHHFSVNLSRWFNVGIFESVVFNRPNSIETDYLNPIIFYTYLEHYNGSPDKEFLGFNGKAIIARHLQLYGQFLVGEFSSANFFSNKGYWANKWGVQFGGKYFDAFGIRNLDLQAEVNQARPFTYAHNDTVVNWSNSNQPLAEPLGSGFIELQGIASMKFSSKFILKLKGAYYIKGSDTGNVNYGNDIFLDYNTRYTNYGVPSISGVKSNCMLLGVAINYRITGNLFFDAGADYRKFTAGVQTTPLISTTGMTIGSNTSYWFYTGIRLNLPMRSYDHYF